MALANLSNLLTFYVRINFLKNLSSDSLSIFFIQLAGVSLITQEDKIDFKLTIGLPIAALEGHTINFC